MESRKWRQNVLPQKREAPKRPGAKTYLRRNVGAKKVSAKKSQRQNGGVLIKQ